MMAQANQSSRIALSNDSVFNIVYYNASGKGTSYKTGVTQRTEPPLVFFLIEKGKRRLYLNHVKPLKSPQPELLD